MPPTRLHVETLEERQVPALFGLPWPDATRLTLSFAPDGTAIAGHASNLFASLDARMTRSAWQGAMLRAFQTWAAQANLDLGVVADGGLAFGTAGPVQGDARFGDVRLGGQAMSPNALSVSVPFDPILSGSWAGDMLVNTGSNLDAAALFRVALHEAGHIFGLPHSTDPRSPMFSHDGGTTTLTAGDISAIQRLYGPRIADANEEKKSNDSIGNATRIKYSESSDGYTGATPIVYLGDVTTSRDADYFWLRPLDNYTGAVTFQVRTAGLSLMAPTLTVFDDRGRLIAESRATGFAGGKVSITLPRVDPALKYYARITGGGGDVFAIGRYALITSFDARNTVSDAEVTRILRAAPSNLSSDDLTELFENPQQGLWAADAGLDNTLLTAEKLTPTAGPNGEAMYTTAGSIDLLGDIDFYRMKLPRQVNNVPVTFTVSIRAGAINGLVPQLQIVDAAGLPVAHEVIVNGEGTFTVQARGLRGNTDYYVRLTDATRTGNYTLAAFAGIQATAQSTFVAGTLATTSPSYVFFVAQPQLFQFTLSAQAVGTATGGMRMEIRNSAGQLVLTQAVAPGETRTASSILLSPGQYSVRFIRDAGATGSLSYRLTGGSLSNPIGPALNDPTLIPQYPNPTNPGSFLYPGGLPSPSPYLWVLLDSSGNVIIPGSGSGYVIGPGGTPLIL